MQILRFCFLIIIFTSTSFFSQIENIPPNNEVYSFLKRIYVKGIILDYDDTVLPLSRNLVRKFLAEIEVSRNKLNLIDQDILDQFNSKLGFREADSSIQFFDRFPETFFPNLAEEKEKHLYRYRDSTVSLIIDPILEYSLIYSDKNKKTGSIINFGGRIRGSYDNWFGYFVEASNGVVAGNPDAARLDKRVEQSFTFNDTRINYFDNTSGYFRLEKGIINFQLGRERLLWGTGQLNKLILSENPPIFDFIKMNIGYKDLRYDFLHGWLVMKPEFRQIGGDISKEKRSKYIAISRLGYSPIPDISLGVSQLIIYSNRSFEAAYLNPFLFWESAQRSLNDLDNSFLAFDGKFRISDGLLVNATSIFDDINFGRLFKGEWNGHNNGFAWQAGLTLTSPLFIDNTIFNIEYLQLRPYIFSHWGFKDALTYTNNSYLMGVDLNPNSTRLSLNIVHNLSSRINFSLRYDLSLHGNNQYDSLGNRTRNVGGNVFEYYTFNDSQFANLLDGVRETNVRFTLGFNWEFINGFLLRINFRHQNNSLISKVSYNSFYGTLNFNID